MWTASYIAMIVGVNVLFAGWPEHSAWWSLIIGLVFVVRDLAQREIGHWILAAMAVAGLATWVLASPFVAIASVSAFAVAELVDWAVYSWTRRPLRDRILVSSAVSVPIDSLIFLGIIGILTPQLLAMQIASKMAAAGIIWSALRWKAA